MLLVCPKLILNFTMVNFNADHSMEDSSLNMELNQDHQDFTNQFYTPQPTIHG